VETFAIVVATIGMLITAVALWFTVSSFKKQLQLNFFADYTKRYQEITLNFPECINEESFRIDNLDLEIKNKTLRYMRAYFDLCSEEYFLWKKGNIDNNTWQEWESGIKFAFSKPAFKQAWEILSLDTIYYGEFTEFVNSAISSQNT
jgi:hypothetical protein